MLASRSLLFLRCRFLALAVAELPAGCKCCCVSQNGGFAAPTFCASTSAFGGDERGIALEGVCFHAHNTMQNGPRRRVCCTVCLLAAAAKRRAKRSLNETALGMMQHILRWKLLCSHQHAFARRSELQLHIRRLRAKDAVLAGEHRTRSADEGL